jgi:hypothetical protein
LITLIENQIAQGFVPTENMDYFTVVNTVDELELALTQTFS